MGSIWLALHQHWRCLWELKELRMSTPSKSQSSTIGGEDYFIWRERMERQQCKNYQQTWTLFCQRKQLREENEELWAQMSATGPSQSQHTQSWHMTSRWTIEASYLGSIEFSPGSYSRQSRKESSSDRQT